MSGIEFEMFEERRRSDWIRLRTLVTLRWVALLGQTIALLVAVQLFGLQLQTGLAAMTVGVSVIVNLVISFIYPDNKRLREREAFYMIVFDIVQLSVMLYLTGGLNNPFAMLLLAPVTIAAAVLHLSSTVMLGAAAIIVTTLLSQFNLPLISATGQELALPGLFQFGFWIALVVAVVFLAIYARQVTTEMHNMGEALLATQLALSREQKLTDLGGVVAATAHELGTPLATIMLVSGEMRDELGDDPDLVEDIDLIHAQATRCREILQSMGQAGKDDLQIREALIEALVQEAAEPHAGRGKTITYDVGPAGPDCLEHPIMPRRPEIVHGLRNLIQNAVDFAETTVDITISWTKTELRVQISDDGAGFPSSVLGRIGDPFVSQRSAMADVQKRPGYSGMGLGMFIAKTLLERSGARLLFRNSPRQVYGSGGAVIDVIWPRQVLHTKGRVALGENQKNVTT
jgi:two-component system sensor histidine kinase RegB